MIKFKEKRNLPRKLTKNIVVLYHNDCTDGFSAAWAAWKKLGNKADYVGINPGTAPINGLKDKEIYMLDLIYSAGYLNELVVANKKFIAIDHHISNQKSFELIQKGIFDTKHSGAVLAWEYFHPKTKIPKLLKHVEDMDLWKFEILGSKEIIACLDSARFDFKEWDKAVKDTEDKLKFKEYLSKGTFILKYQNQLIENIIANHTVLVEFSGYKSYAVNSPVFNSQIASILNKKLPPIGIVWTQENNGSIHVSLRSDGTVDVSEIASKFGNGGGHRRSAGFNVENLDKLPWEK